MPKLINGQSLFKKTPPILLIQPVVWKRSIISRTGIRSESQLEKKKRLNREAVRKHRKKKAIEEQKKKLEALLKKSKSKSKSKSDDMWKYINL